MSDADLRIVFLCIRAATEKLLIVTFRPKASGDFGETRV
jgi:hypothetical protein